MDTPSVVKVLKVLLVVLIAVILFSLAAILFAHDTMLHAAVFIFASLGAVVILVIMGITSVFYGRR
jgi:hypothetical protein